MAHSLNRLIAVAAGCLLLQTSAPLAAAAKLPDSWDGLVRVKSKNLQAVYLAPEADFRAYTKVLLDPTEVAFRKNWQRDYNSERRSLSHQVSNADAKEILDKARAGYGEIQAQAFRDAGFQIATAPGPDVLKVSTAIINLDVEAVDQMTAGRSYTFTREAGGATLVVEVRDSQTGAVLGRAVDAQSTGDQGPYLRNSVTNRAEFERLFADWAKTGAKGLTMLKSLSPIDVNGNHIAAR